MVPGKRFFSCLERFQVKMIKHVMWNLKSFSYLFFHKNTLTSFSLFSKFTINLTQKADFAGASSYLSRLNGKIKRGLKEGWFEPPQEEGWRDDIEFFCITCKSNPVVHSGEQGWLEGRHGVLLHHLQEQSSPPLR